MYLGFRFLGLSSLCLCSVPEEDMVKRKGKPWRGGCQRGQRLCKYIVSLFSKTGDTIVDLFAGTGTLGLIAAVMERNVIIFEKDHRIYNKLLEPYSTKVIPKLIRQGTVNTP